MPSRRSPSLLSRLATAFVCLLAAAGAWVWLSSRPVQELDAVFYDAWEKVWGEGTPASRPVLLGSQQIMPLEKVPRRVLRRQYPEVAYAMLDEEQVAAHFHQAPIQPLDFAVLLHETRKGFTNLGISSPWGWSSCDPLVQETLRRAFRAFPSCVLGLRGRTASRPEFTPPELAGGALDSAKITGSIAFLPSANASLPHALANWGGGPFAPWAIDWVEGERLMEDGRESGVSYPLLVRWHGDIYPTLPLRLMMLAEGVQPDEIGVEVGSHISWRDTRLPLDSFGRTTLDAQCRTRRASLSELMEGGNGADSAEKKVSSGTIGKDGARYLLLCEPVLSQPGEEDRAEWMAATLSQLARRTSERTEWTTRPIAGRALHLMIEGSGTLAVALGVGFVFLLVVPGRRRAVHLGAETLVILLAIAALGAVIGAGRWVPVAPWAIALVVLFAGGRVLRLRQPRRRS